MANSTVCQSKWKPIAEPRRAMSDWVKTWLETLKRYRDSELLKLFRSDIQDGRNSSKDFSFQTVERIKQKLDGRHRSDLEIQNC